MIMLLTVLGAFAALPGQSRPENWKLCRSDDPERSIAGCSALIQSGQETGINLAKAFYSRGWAYARKGDYDRAIADYDRALQLNPSLANAYYSLGVAYEHKGDFDRAIGDFDQALRLTPNDADAFYGRGLAYARRGYYDSAIQDYDQALRINSSYAAAFYNRSRAYMHKGDYLRAMADHGHFLWLKFGILGITIRVWLVVLAVALGFAFKRFLKGLMRGQQY
jgi:tetratricopeptide (TPR) repeat protein